MNEASEKPTIQPKPVLLWGGRAIAKHLNLSPRKFYHRMAKGQLKGIDRVGDTFTATEESLAANYPKIEESKNDA